MPGWPGMIMPALMPPSTSEVGAGDERALVGREEQRGVGDVAHLAAAPDAATRWRSPPPRGDAAPKSKSGGSAADHHLHVPGRRAHRVDADAEAARARARRSS